MESSENNKGEGALIPDVDGADRDLWAQPLIEYWIWNGARLIPASADDADRLREREAFLRLERWQHQQERERRKAAVHEQWSALPMRLVAFGAKLGGRMFGSVDKGRGEPSRAPSSQ